MKQTILVSDSKGNHTGEYIDKDLAHTGRGKRHLAISVLLYNKKAEVLLQHRKHKIHSNIWDISGSTHHLHKANGQDETSEEATYRCLRDEYGVVEKIPLKVLGGINYFAQDGDLCENEHDIIITGEFNGLLKPNKDVAYKHKWMAKEVLLRDIVKNPKKYAPWAVIAAKLLKKTPEEKFKPALNDFLEDFEKYRKDFFSVKKRELKKRRHLATFYDDLEKFTDGGKKLRAFLVYLGYLIAKDKSPKKVPQELLSICLSVEILHSFFLIHDDVMDRSDMRRGMPTVHKKYSKVVDDHFGESMAMTLGDIAAFESLSLISSSRFKEKVKLAAIEFLIKTALNTGYGQVLDVYGSHEKLLEKEVVGIIDYKTVDYSVVMPLALGVILGEGTASKLKVIGEFGLYAGRAFQMQDDILGVFGEEAQIGKSILSDMREGKNTLLIFKTRENASKENRQVLGRLWGNSKATKTDLETVKGIILNSGALTTCVSEKEKLAKKAAQVAVKMTKNKVLIDVFVEISDFISRRRS